VFSGCPRKHFNRCSNDATKNERKSTFLEQFKKKNIHLLKQTNSEIISFSEIVEG
jgi:hypothetical protein